MNNKQLYQLAFSFIKGMNGARAQILLEQMDDIEFIFNNTTLSIKHLKKTKNDFLSKESLDNALRKANEEALLIEKNHITPLFFTEKAYPFRLRECRDAPLMLYTQGNKPLNAGKVLSVVGTRKSSPYGDEMTNNIIQGLSERFNDLLVVSGLAYGIDIAAHKSCIQHRVNTAAVLAHGLHVIYPNQHYNTAKTIADQSGVLVSEFSFYEKPEKHHFVKRNRIIAGLADATLVVESANKGGALITAHIAQSYNRDVLAIPGRVGETSSQGCNKLIKTNIASLVENIEDICFALNWNYENTAPIQGKLFYEASEQELKIIEQLTIHKDLSMNELCRELNIPISQLSSTLLNMEFNNLIQALPGNRYKVR